MTRLFSPLRLRDIELKNRVVVSPMCEYSAADGHPQSWHLVHLGKPCRGGAQAWCSPRRRLSRRAGGSRQRTLEFISIHMLRRGGPIAQFIRSQSTVAGMQLAHAGRKGSTSAPWLGGKKVPLEAGGWEPVAPSAVAFADDYPMPRALARNDISEMVEAFRKAAARALDAGFEALEIHGAHGYLIHEFLSPLSNFRQDEYGGSFENRIRFAIQVVRGVREIWPARLPLFFRVSATDWKEGGWDLAQTIELGRILKTVGVDLIDVSSGGLVPGVKIPVGPGYQVPFAAEIRKQAGTATGAVGMITEPAQAETILQSDQADVVLLARELLRDPYWPLRAAKTLGEKIKPPVQYERAW